MLFSEREGEGKHGSAGCFQRRIIPSAGHGQGELRQALEDEIGKEGGPQFVEYQPFQSRVRFSWEVHGRIRQEEHSAAQRQNEEQPVWAMGYRHCESGNPPSGESKEPPGSVNKHIT